MNKSLMFLLASIVLVPALSGVATAQMQTDYITPIGTDMGISKSAIEFSIPENNSMPWAYIEGTVDNAVPDHPVIIQIYDSQGDAVLFAQTNVNQDGSYEYKFRVTETNEYSTINIFAGDYTVKIFKTVYLDDNLSVV